MHHTDMMKLQFGYQQQMFDPPKCLREHQEMSIIKSWQKKSRRVEKRGAR